MSLHVYSDIEQGTDEWLELRRGMVTASTVGQLITAKTIKPAANADARALTAKLVAERITGWIEDTYPSFDMQRGTLDEPIARDLYSQHYAPVVECGFMVREEPDWELGWSPDGLVGDEGGIEIKSRKPKEQLATVLADEVPAANMAQIQAGMFVSGRGWIDYVSYCGGMNLYVKRVLPNKRWQDAIAAAVTAFESAAIDMADRYTAAVVGLPMTERVDHFPDVELHL